MHIKPLILVVSMLISKFNATDTEQVCVQHVSVVCNNKTNTLKPKSTNYLQYSQVKQGDIELVMK